MANKSRRSELSRETSLAWRCSLAASLLGFWGALPGCDLAADPDTPSASSATVSVPAPPATDHLPTIDNPEFVNWNQFEVGDGVGGRLRNRRERAEHPASRSLKARFDDVELVNLARSYPEAADVFCGAAARGLGVGVHLAR